MQTSSGYCCKQCSAILHAIRGCGYTGTLDKYIVCIPCKEGQLPFRTILKGLKAVWLQGLEELASRVCGAAEEVDQDQECWLWLPIQANTVLFLRNILHKRSAQHCRVDGGASTHSRRESQRAGLEKHSRKTSFTSSHRTTAYKHTTPSTRDPVQPLAPTQHLNVSIILLCEAIHVQKRRIGVSAIGI